MSGPPLPEVDGYTLRRVIGSGGFSTVYEATQDDIGSSVALKVLNVSIHDEAGTRRLAREYRSMGRLRDQPGIVPVYTTTQARDGRAVIVMAYLPGGSLADRIRRDGPLAAEAVLRLASDLAAALDAAHAMGIHHRDIEPENVLFDARGNAALSDFGLATVEGIADASTTAASLSPPHAPPERFTGDRAVDPVAADISSFASTICTALAGEAPFGSSADRGIGGLMTRILTADPAPFDRPDVSPAFTGAVMAGLAKDPALRPRSAGALVGSGTDSARSDAGSPTSSADASITDPGDGDTRARAVTTNDHRTRVIAGPPPRRSGRRRAMVIMTIAVLITAIVGVGVYAVRPHADRRDRPPRGMTDRATEGTTVAGGNGQGNAPNQLANPFGIAIDRNNNLYIADEVNDRVVRWKAPQ